MWSQSTYSLWRSTLFSHEREVQAGFQTYSYLWTWINFLIAFINFSWNAFWPKLVVMQTKRLEDKMICPRTPNVKSAGVTSNFCRAGSWTGKERHLAGLFPEERQKYNKRVQPALKAEKPSSWKLCRGCSLASIVLLLSNAFRNSRMIHSDKCLFFWF